MPERFCRGCIGFCSSVSAAVPPVMVGPVMLSGERASFCTDGRMHDRRSYLLALLGEQALVHLRGQPLLLFRKQLQPLKVQRQLSSALSPAGKRRGTDTSPLYTSHESDRKSPAHAGRVRCLRRSSASTIHHAAPEELAKLDYFCSTTPEVVFALQALQGYPTRVARPRRC